VRAAAPEPARRRASLWPTVIALPALAVLVGLGVWQLERRAWKAELIAARAERLAAPALGPADLARPPAELAFHRIRLAGRFRHDLEVLVQPRTRNGEAGAHVVTPFVLAGGARAPSTVLVDRGWVPHDRRDPATRGAGQIAGALAIGGIVTPGGRASGWTPDNDPARDAWYYVDPPAIAARLRQKSGTLGPVPDGIPDLVVPNLVVPNLVVPNLVVEADAAPVPGGLPIGGQTVTDIPSRHLEYALTWFSLAAALAVIYVIALRRALGHGRRRAA
jgi:surfeit locus 1 family protein